MDINVATLLLELDPNGQICLRFAYETAAIALSNSGARCQPAIIACAEHLAFLVKSEFQTELQVIASEAAAARGRFAD